MGSLQQGERVNKKVYINTFRSQSPFGKPPEKPQEVLCTKAEWSQNILAACHCYLGTSARANTVSDTTNRESTELAQNKKNLQSLWRSRTTYKTQTDFYVMLCICGSQLIATTWQITCYLLINEELFKAREWCGKPLDSTLH